MHQGRAAPFQAPHAAPTWVRDLEAIDRVLREHEEVTKLLVADVANALTGQNSGPLTAQQWLRALLVQQTSRYSDDEMGFRLNDSQACRAFCMLEDVFIPEATIHANLRRFDDSVWRRIKRSLKPYMGRAWRKNYGERVPG